MKLNIQILQGNELLEKVDKHQKEISFILDNAYEHRSMKEYFFNNISEKNLKYLFLFLDGNKIAGLRGMTSVDLKLDHLKIKTKGCSMVIRKEYRGKGLG